MPKMYSPQRPAFVDVAGESYYPDENSVFTVPEPVVPALKKRGFIDAAAYLQRIAETEAKPSVAPMPVQAAVIQSAASIPVEQKPKPQEPSDKK